jgi:hypothetical protein
MLINVDMKIMLLDRYLNSKTNVKKNELFSIYVQIMNITYDLIEKYGVEKVEDNFVELFESKIIFFDKQEQVQYFIDQNLLKNIIKINKILQNEVKLPTIKEKNTNVVNDNVVNDNVVNDNIVNDNVVNTVTKELENQPEAKIEITPNSIHNEVENVVENVVNLTVEHLKKSSLADRLKTKVHCVKQKLKTLQGNLSHCLGGGKTST